MLGLRRGIPLYRTYSVAPDFLSDLLKRVDQVTTRASSLKPHLELPSKRSGKKVDGDAKRASFKKRSDGSAPKNASGKVGANNETRKSTSKGNSRDGEFTTSAIPSSLSASSIKVKSHPLMNTFGAAYAGTSFSLSSGDSSRGGPRRSPGPQRAGAGKSNYTRSLTAPSNTANSAQRSPKRPRSVPLRSKQAGKKEVVFATTSPKLVPVEPVLSADALFYGKVATVNTSVPSRVASLAKQTLVDSKYPYLLPKLAIDSLPSTPQNKFIAQRNYSLEVDQETFFSRFRSLVLGKYSPLQIPPNLVPATEAAYLVSRNGSIPQDLKQKIVGAVAGTLLVKELLGDAAWVNK